MNETFAGVLAGMSIVLAGFVGLLSLLALSFGQVELNWDGA
ncbi:hypothetical protein [Arthrobacter ruber]|nr:hypothetical protein [Arthrobacter ruber]